MEMDPDLKSEVMFVLRIFVFLLQLLAVIRFPVQLNLTFAVYKPIYFLKY